MSDSIEIYNNLDMKSKRDFLLELDSFEKFYDQVHKGGLRHQADKDAMDLIASLNIYLRPFAYATRDDSWGEFEKLFLIFFSNYLRIETENAKLKEIINGEKGE